MAQAYVTLVTNADYLPGVRALVNSLKLTGTSASIVILHTPAVDEALLAPLGVKLIECDLLPMSEGFNARHARKALHGAAPFTKGEKPSFHTPLDNFVKLRLWELEQYKSVVFLDADTIVLRNIDRLFDYPEFSAAPNVYESLGDFHRLNSGVFTAKPRMQTYRDMLARLDDGETFWRRTDQTFLQDYFPDWQGLPIFDNLLQYVWFNMPELWSWEQARVVHFQYEKPWQADHPKREALAPLIALWQDYHDGRAPDLTALPSP
ncbi:glycosyltransferase [Paracoccaceae bacterium GXU_MW_L88]